MRNPPEGNEDSNPLRRMLQHSDGIGKEKGGVNRKAGGGYRSNKKAETGEAGKAGMIDPKCIPDRESKPTPLADKSEKKTQDTY
jgi:hypothetical protein